MSWDDNALADLNLHWGSAYNIWNPGYSAPWCALFRDEPGAAILSAADAAELRILIRADYDRRTVKKAAPRGAAQEGGDRR